MTNGFKGGRLFAAIATVILATAACSSTGGGAASGAASGSAAASGGGGTIKIGYSNGGGVGNGFREEQVCTAKAEAKALGNIDLTVIHRNTDAAGQLADIRSLIAKGVQAIVFNPNDPAALNPALAEAKAAGIKTVSVDAYVTDPNTWNLYNNQVKYAELGAKWLFDQLNGKGSVWYTRGIAGNPADTDRDKGFKNVLKDYPNIKVVPNNDGVFTKWDVATATQLANDFIASGGYDKIDGIWTSGMDSQVVTAVKKANKPFKPIVGADIGAFVSQLLDTSGYPNLKGVAVTNTASVGGAGVSLAVKLLKGETVTADPNAGRPNTVLLDPVAVDNTTDAGKNQLKAWQSIPGMDPLWPLSLDIKGWTTYDPNTVPASCKGA